MTDEVKGYKPLNEDQLAAVNFFKDMETDLITEVQLVLDGQANYTGGDTTKVPLAVDKRWASIAKTHFQEGFMAMTRAITRPDGE